MSHRKTIAIIAISLLVAGVAGRRYLAGSAAGAAGRQGVVVQAERRYPVQTTLAGRRVFQEASTVQGTVQPKRFADIPSRVFGVLDAVFVDEGDTVERGVTQLFQVDQENLQRAVRIAQQELAVARCSLRESEANLERIQADLHKAELDYARFKRLREKEAATAEAVEQQESRYLQALALRKHAKAIIDLNTERVRQAEIAAEIAAKNLSDSLVLAPVDGTVTLRLREPGEIAEEGKTILRIEDLSTLEVSAFFPAHYYGSVVVGRTQMRIRSGEQEVGTFPVTFKSPTIDNRLRTFEVRCILVDTPDDIASGAMVDVELALERHEGLGVPRDSVQMRGGQSVVFVIEGDRVRMVPVQTGLINDGWVEIAEGTLAKGTAVVTAGQHMLNDGVAVNVQRKAD